MKNLGLIVGVVWIVFITTLAFSQVGDIPSCSKEPHDMQSVFTIFMYGAIPFACGLFHGKANP